MESSIADQFNKQEAEILAARKAVEEAEKRLQQAGAGQGARDSAQQAVDTAVANYRQTFRGYQAFIPEKLLFSKPLARAAYSDRMAWIMAIMTNLAYNHFENDPLELERTETSLATGGFKLVNTFNHGSTQAFLAKGATFMVLAFRGTQEREDIGVDLRAYMKATTDGRVAAGFEDAYNEVARDVVDILTLAENATLPLYITGHSLGAALATIATQRMEKIIGDRIAACYTFGSPRVGNAYYEQNVKSAVYRVVHSTDIVTLVPSLGYHHVGDPRFISYGGKLWRGIPLFQRGLDMLIALLPFFWGRWFTCHLIGDYITKLEKIAADRNPNSLS